MRSFALHVRFPTGTILIGGHSALPSGISSSHAEDPRGRPFIPATALRGALRETLEALLRGVQRGACDSGSGIDPTTAPGGTKPRPCSVDAGEPCVPCRIFGTRRPKLSAHERSFSSLILGDAVLEDEDPVDWVERPQVAISRTSRSAEDQRLFMRRVPSLVGRVLVARGHTVDPELDQYLEAAVRATKHLGSGRSIGLARVELELEWLDGPSPGVVERSTPTPSTIGIRLRLESLTAIGTADASDNYRSTRSEIPGSMLRGALGFAIARAMPKTSEPRGDQPFGDPELQALVDESEGAQFGFLQPVDAATTACDVAAPFPITARACKAHPWDHGVVDTLLDRIVVAMISSPAQAERVHQTTFRRCRAKPGGRLCDAPLRSAKGSRRSQTDPAKRVITRVSLERSSTSARDGALFSYEMLEPGAIFEGTIRSVPAKSRSLLARALQLPLYVGRGSSSGWGRVSVEIIDPVARPSIEERGAKFEAALDGRLSAADLPTDGVDRILPITFLAPLLPDDDTDDGRVTLEAHLGKVEWLVVARRFVRDGGWDQRNGNPFAALAVVAGAVYVARLPRPWHKELALLEALERGGAGRRRHQGYGHLVLFDPFILNRGNPP